MKNPTKQQVGIAISTLQKAYRMANRNAPVDMMEGDVVKKNYCGTPMCHGGWYAIVNEMADFLDGARKMAEDLGFSTIGDLKMWAMKNPDIWGNKDGAYMFSNGEAFDKDSDTGFTLLTIINHWKAVQKRLAE